MLIHKHTHMHTQALFFFLKKEGHGFQFRPEIEEILFQVFSVKGEKHLRKSVPVFSSQVSPPLFLCLRHEVLSGLT